MEPTGFDHHGPDHSGPSSRVALPSDLRPDPIPPMNTYYATILVEDVEIGRYVTADNFDAAYVQAEAGTQSKHPRAHILVRALQFLNSGVPDRAG